MRREAARSAGPKLMPCIRGLAAAISSTLVTPRDVSRMAWTSRGRVSPARASSWARRRSTKWMSQGPSTLGIMTTSSLWPISPTTWVRSSSIQGESRLLTLAHSWVSPRSISRPTRISPSRAATLRSTGTASSRLPSRMSVLAAISGALATILSLEKSRKWIIRDGRNSTSRGGSGAPMARGLKKSRGFRTAPTVSTAPRGAPTTDPAAGQRQRVASRLRNAAQGVVGWTGRAASTCSTPSCCSPCSAATGLTGILLARTMRATDRINAKAKTIARTGQGINSATDSVVQLEPDERVRLVDPGLDAAAGRRPGRHGRPRQGARRPVGVPRRLDRRHQRHGGPAAGHRQRDERHRRRHQRHHQEDRRQLGRGRRHHPGVAGTTGSPQHHGQGHQRLPGRASSTPPRSSAPTWSRSTSGSTSAWPSTRTIKRDTGNLLAQVALTQRYVACIDRKVGGAGADAHC